MPAYPPTSCSRPNAMRWPIARLLPRLKGIRCAHNKKNQLTLVYAASRYNQGAETEESTPTITPANILNSNSQCITSMLPGILPNTSLKDRRSCFLHSRLSVFIHASFNRPVLVNYLWIALLILRLF